MTDSENDTLPFTPESFADRDIEGLQDGIFAWLRPHSPTARAAFDAVVNASIKYQKGIIILGSIYLLRITGTREPLAFTLRTARSKNLRHASGRGF